MAEHRTTVDALLARAATGDDVAWGALLVEHAERLTRMVMFRLDPRLRGRVDASDVVQEAFLQAAAHRADFFRQPNGSIFFWLRAIANNKLLELHRNHLGTHKRDAARDVALDRQRSAVGSESTSDALIAHLTGGATGPATAAGRADVGARLRAALDEMEPIDREVLALRHFEQLTSAEAADVLGIQERAASKRYLRALERLRGILSEMPGGLTELRP